MTTYRIPRLLTLLLIGALLPLIAGAATANQGPDQGDDYGYGFYRTIEGKALLTGLEQDAEPLEIEPNYPVLTGDRIWVDGGSRVEAVLPDRVLLRLGADTEVFFESLAGSADAPEDAATVLRLFDGEIQIVGDEYVLSDEPLSVLTENGRMYLELPGTYRLTSDGRGWTEVVVRDGFAEINTERGSVIARAGEGAVIEGDYRPEVSTFGAQGLDDLEYWGVQLSSGQGAPDGYVDDSLAYAAAPLDDAGEWVSTSGRAAWRPAVRAGWRPFSDGWWTYTPSGLSWVAYEPWGWLTSHYGAWDYEPGYGWLWFPGSTYSPAWVYWYWGPTHSAWVPSGYYTRYYGAGLNYGFRFGVYGWAGGSWDSWARWTFCPTRYFGRRSYRSYWRSGHDMHRDRRLHAVPRGVITTDTRDIHPRRWGKPTEIVSALERRHGQDARSPRDLGDVTSFVERRPNLPEDVKRVVRSNPRSPEADRRSDLARGTANRATPRRTSEDPWRVKRPDSLRGVSPRDQTPSLGARRGDARATDWELIERLRRFENKQEGLPASPRTGSANKSQTTRPTIPRPATPTRKILDGVRSRDPRSVPQRRTPATSPQRPTSPPAAQRRTPTTSPQRPTSPPAARRPTSTSSGSRRPTSNRGATARPSGSSPRSSGSMSKPRPSSKPSSSKPRSGSTSRSSARKKKG